MYSDSALDWERPHSASFFFMAQDFLQERPYFVVNFQPKGHPAQFALEKSIQVCS